MDQNVQIPRGAVAAVVAVGLALMAGLALASPLSYFSVIFVAGLFMVLVSPLLLRWYHALTICFWNTVFVAFFLPGRPPIWVVVAVIGLACAVVTNAIRNRPAALRVWSVSWPLIALAVVVVITLLVRGGFGARSLGSDMWGSKRYLTLLGGIVGYFVLTSQVIPRARAQWYAGLFFLTGVTAVLSDIVFVAGPSFYFLFNFLSVDVAANQVMTQDTLRRFTGLAWLAQAVYWFLLLRYGIRGVFDLRQPWRVFAFVLLFGVSLFGGFRSSIILLALLFLTQFWYERLLRTKFFPIALACGVLVSGFVLAFAENLPLSMQRSLTFLPIKVHPMARQDAEGSLDWRLSMWKVVAKEVPQYLWLGKGFTFSGVDLYLVNESIRRGYFELYEEPLVTGNYHSGPLTLLVPFGVFGSAAFAVFIVAGWRVLRRNYLYGDPELRNINTFLIAFFAARFLFFLIFYGQFDLDLMVFTGVVGLSIAINGGVKSSPVELAVHARGH